jgi:hypothetical protein
VQLCSMEIVENNLQASQVGEGRKHKIVGWMEARKKSCWRRFAALRSFELWPI